MVGAVTDKRLMLYSLPTGMCFTPSDQAVRTRSGQHLVGVTQFIAVPHCPRKLFRVGQFLQVSLQLECRRPARDPLNSQQLHRGVHAREFCASLAAAMLGKPPLDIRSNSGIQPPTATLKQIDTITPRCRHRPALTALYFN